MTGQEMIVGILGGMGPEATIDLFSKIVRSTPVSRDQDHLHLIIDNNPRVPDRQKAILENGPSPARMLIVTAQNLVAAGADFIVMPCNTAHYWIEEIRKAVAVPIVDMIEETAKETVRLYPSLRTVGIMAATGTARSGLYQKQFRNLAIKTVLPTDGDQPTLMQAIYSVKGGDLSKSSTNVIEIGQKLVKMGAEAVIAGCTELPLILKTGDLPVPIIDATQILATRAIQIARGKSNIP
ncbi:MAG: amino acid racemase [Candidatus Bathyarchaeia archaeon]